MRRQEAEEEEILPPKVNIPDIVPAQDGDQLTEAELLNRIKENI